MHFLASQLSSRTYLSLNLIELQTDTDRALNNVHFHICRLQGVFNLVCSVGLAHYHYSVFEGLIRSAEFLDLSSETLHPYVQV